MQVHRVVISGEHQGKGREVIDLDWTLSKIRIMDSGNRLTGQKAGLLPSEVTN